MSGRRLLFIFAAIAVSLSGISPSRTEAKELPKRLFVDVVQMPDKPYVLGSNDSQTGLLHGALIASAVGFGKQDIDFAYAELLSKNKIDVGADLAFEVSDALSKKGFELVNATQADGTLNIFVQNYGLFSRDGITVIPTVTVVITIKDRAGKRIATKQALWALIKEIKEDVQPTPIGAVFKDPKNLAAQIHKVNAIVVATALRKM